MENSLLNDSTEVFIYKISCLLVGFGFAYIGFILFKLGIYKSGGNFAGKHKDIEISLKNAAPGSFFSMVGGFVLIYTITQGFSITTSRPLVSIGETLLDTVSHHTNKVTNSDKRGDSLKLENIENDIKKLANRLNTINVVLSKHLETQESKQINGYENIIGLPDVRKSIFSKNYADSIDCVTLPVTFTLKSNPNDTLDLSYSWDFGDNRGGVFTYLIKYSLSNSKLKRQNGSVIDTLFLFPIVLDLVKHRLNIKVSQKKQGKFK